MKQPSTAARRTKTLVRGPGLLPVKTEHLVDVARMFYLDGTPQLQIALALGLDPSTVSRYLRRARDEGIVRVEIRPPTRLLDDLGLALAERFSIARAIVVDGEAEVGNEFAFAAADYVASLLKSGMRLGVSWGRTLSGLASQLRASIVSELEIAQLAGGLGDTVPGAQGHELVRHIAALYPPSHAHYLHAPAVVDSDEIRRAIVSDRTVETALAAGARSELALVGIGTLGDEATLVRDQHLSPQDRLRLLADGSVGNMNTRFFNDRGEPVQYLEHRTVAISWQELKNIPTVVAVAAGLVKCQAIRGALRTGCVDVLVTDQITARMLLDISAGEGNDGWRPETAVKVRTA